MPEVSIDRLQSRCREAEPTEIESLVLPLWRAGMSDRKIVERIEQRYAWLYGQAPAGRTRTWVVRDPETGAAVGAGSVLPIDYLADGKSLKAGMLIDFIVSPQARTAGPAVMLQREIARQCAANGFTFLFGYPNRRAWPVMVRAGYKALSTTRTWVRPMAGDVATIREKLAQRIASLSPKIPARLATMCAAPLAAVCLAGVTLLDAAIGLYGGLLGYRMAIGPMTGDPPAIADRANTLVSRKPVAGYPAWRFERHPTHHYSLAVLTRRGQVQAWTVLRHVDDRVEIQDAAWSGANTGAARMLWLALPRALAAQGIRKMSVSILGDAEIDKHLRAAFYLRSSETRNVVLHLPEGTDPKLAAMLWAPENWRIFAGELDV